MKCGGVLANHNLLICYYGLSDGSPLGLVRFYNIIAERRINSRSTEWHLLGLFIYLLVIGGVARDNGVGHVGVIE